ncbi:hypothetical protein [Halobacillus seohaensis]|uniref:Uncharacterized protein n=1 Tax=Halobacillus seohaensis TaxID=447421 RepID=A0ABW2ELM8_9BACI
MGPSEIIYSLIKALLYFALAIVLFAHMFEYQPLSQEARVIIAMIALFEAIMIVRKIDNRNQKSEQ